MTETPYSNHIVLIGWDNFAREVCRQLVNAGKLVVAITDQSIHIQAIEALYPDGEIVPLLSHRENFEALREAGIERASNVFINITDDKEKLIYIFKLRKVFPLLRIVAPVNNPNLKETFVNAAEIHPLSKDEISAKMFASYLFEEDVAAYTSDLFATAVEDTDYDIQQFYVKEDNPLTGRPYGEVFLELKKSVNAILIGLSKGTGENQRLLKKPPNETLVEPGDYLILILSGAASGQLEHQFGVSEGALESP